MPLDHADVEVTITIHKTCIPENWESAFRTIMRESGIEFTRDDINSVRARILEPQDA